MNRILIVEDDADSLKALGVRLRSSGFEIVAATDAATAITRARQQRPDLVILDLGLPAGDGFVVMERLRAMAATASVPIIVLTGRDPAVHQERAMKNGAVAFFQKPADNTALLDAIRSHLPTGTQQNAPRKILLVEDDAMTRQAMTIRLRHHGFEVVAASDAATALTTTSREKPHVVLLDIGLPGGGGIAVLERLRLQPALASIPVIVVTARADEAVRQQALSAGARTFLTKPVDPQVLIEAINGVLSGD